MALLKKLFNISNFFRNEINGTINGTDFILSFNDVLKKSKDTFSLEWVINHFVEDPNSHY